MVQSYNHGNVSTYVSKREGGGTLIRREGGQDWTMARQRENTSIGSLPIATQSYAVL